VSGELRAKGVWWVSSRLFFQQPSIACRTCQFSQPIYAENVNHNLNNHPLRAEKVR